MTIGNLGAFCLLQGRRERVVVVRIDDDAVDALVSAAFRALPGRRAFPVAFYDGYVAEPIRLGLDLIQHAYNERKTPDPEQTPGSSGFVAAFAGASTESAKVVAPTNSAILTNFASPSIPSFPRAPGEP